MRCIICFFRWVLFLILFIVCMFLYMFCFLGWVNVYVFYGFVYVFFVFFFDFWFVGCFCVVVVGLGSWSLCFWGRVVVMVRFMLGVVWGKGGCFGVVVGLMSFGWVVGVVCFLCVGGKWGLGVLYWGYWGGYWWFWGWESFLVGGGVGLVGWVIFVDVFVVCVCLCVCSLGGGWLVCEFLFCFVFVWWCCFVIIFV